MIQQWIEAALYGSGWTFEEIMEGWGGATSTYSSTLKAAWSQSSSSRRAPRW